MNTNRMSILGALWLHLFFFLKPLSLVPDDGGDGGGGGGDDGGGGGGGDGGGGGGDGGGGNVPGVAELFAEGDESFGFAEGWNQKLGGEFAGNEKIAGFKSLGALRDGYGNLLRAFHEGGKINGFPDGSDPEAVTQWNNAVGVPAEVAGYNLDQIQAPEGLELPDGIQAEIGKAFQSAGIAPGQAAKLYPALLALEKSMADQAGVLYQGQLQEYDGKLRSFMGGGDVAQEKIEGIKQVVSTFTDPITGQAYDPTDAELFDNPKVVGFMSQVLDALSEDDLAGRREMGSRVTGETNTQEANRIMDQANLLVAGQKVDNLHPMAQRYAAGDAVAREYVKKKLGGKGDDPYSGEGGGGF